MFPGGGIWVRRAEGVRREEHDAIRKGKRLGGTDYAELLDLIYQLSVCSNGDPEKKFKLGFNCMCGVFRL